MADDPTRVERYLAHLDDLSGGVEPEFWRVPPTSPDRGSITAIGYRDQPEPGLFLGFTYGLSLTDQPAWTHGRPELSICVATDDPAWVLACAAVAERLREDYPFSYGNTIALGSPIADGTDMDGFVVFAPIALDPAVARVDVGDDLPVHVVGLYPTHESERRFIAERGLEAWWELEWDPHDVARPPSV